MNGGIWLKRLLSADISLWPDAVSGFGRPNPRGRLCLGPTIKELGDDDPQDAKPTPGRVEVARTVRSVELEAGDLGDREFVLESPNVQQRCDIEVRDVVACREQRRQCGASQREVAVAKVGVAAFEQAIHGELEHPVAGHTTNVRALDTAALEEA